MHQKTNGAPTARPAPPPPPCRQPSVIRIELDQQRRFRVEQLQELTAEAAQAIATADDPRLQVNGVLKFAAESALAEIDGAMRRLEQGTYGMCERCTKPIAWERLEALPMTGLCTPCQWMAESDHARSRRIQKSSSSRIQRQEA